MDQERFGDWMETYSGRKLYPLDIREEDLDIEDIAHALSMNCRYNGHCQRFYSVAEHCVLLADYVSRFQYPYPLCDDVEGIRQMAFEALMHDASEAYLTDIPRPLKSFLPDYLRAEKVAEAVIAHKYGLTYPMPAWLKELDTRILVDERHQLMSASGNVWSMDDMEPLGILVQSWTPCVARSQFLNRFERYGS